MPFNGTIADEVRVLRACLEGGLYGTRQVVKTATYVDPVPSLQTLRPLLPDLRGETVEDYLAKNARSHRVPPELASDGRFQLVDSGELGEGFDDYDGWELFNRRFPDSRGGIFVSRVGFDPGLTQALVMIGHQRHWLSESGYYSFCVRSDGEWHEAGRLMSWIS